MTTKYPKLPDSSKIYLGIDQSLKVTSFCLLENQEIHIEQVKPLYMGVSRITEIYEEFMTFLEAHPNIEGAAIEGYAFAAKGAVFNLGEIGGVLRMALYNHKIPSIEVPPTYLKKFITGKGTSAKNMMMKEAYKKYGVDLDDDNDCDAFSLAVVAYAYFETKLHPIKSYREEFHKNCKQIVGEHPNPLTVKEYFQGMPDITIAEYEKQKRLQKKAIED